jgi:tetratricopeptide (TPR) repeat protein
MAFKSKPRVLGLAGLASLLLMTAASAGAQIGGIDSDPGDRGTGGRNTIQGRIFLPGGRKLDSRAKVRLRNITGYDRFIFSDDSGVFTFRRLQNGTYTVTVDAGPDFQIATETIDIIEPPRRANDPGMAYTVIIMLQAKGSSPVGRNGTIDAAATEAPEQARQLYKRAIEFAQKGDRGKAIDQLKHAVEIYPNFMAALNEMGVQYMELKDWEKADQALRAAIKIAPEAFHPRLNHGIVLLQMKDYKNAAAELRIAVQKDSSSPLAHFQCGRALVSLGDYDSAETYLKRAIDIGGASVAEAHRYLAAAYIEKRKTEPAAHELELYLKLVPNARDAEKISNLIKDLRSQASR